MHGLGLGLIQAKTSPDPQKKNYYEKYTQNTSTQWSGVTVSLLQVRDMATSRTASRSRRDTQHKIL